MLINSYDFSIGFGIQDIMHFIQDLNAYTSRDSEVLVEHVQKNFVNIVDNFYKLQQYLGIDEKWSLFYPPTNQNKLDIISVQNTKLAIHKILIKSILHRKYRNIICEFHRFQPFNKIAEQIYKLLINAFLDIKSKFDIDQQVVLSLYLTHAAVYNNTNAIKILIEEYRVSPIVTWAELPAKYAYINLTIMPILLTVNAKLFRDNLKFFDVTWEHQQNNFMLMLSVIDFSQSNITLSQIQQIFKCALDNNFVHSINYLLEQVEFCKRIECSQGNARLLEENNTLKEQISLLEQRINKLQIDLQNSRQKHEVLLSKQELLLNKFHYKRCYNCLTLSSTPKSPGTPIPSTPVLYTPTFAMLESRTSPDTPVSMPDRLNTYLKLQYSSSS